MILWMEEILHQGGAGFFQPRVFVILHDFISIISHD